MGVPVAPRSSIPNAGHWPAWHEMAFYYNAHPDFFTRPGRRDAPYDVIAHARNLAFGQSP